MKKFFSLIAAVLTLSGCNAPEEGISALPETSDGGAQSINDYEFEAEGEIYDNECSIELGENVSINGEGAWFSDNRVTISESGVYTVTGSLSSGNLYIKGKQTVKLILENAEIISDNGPAITSESDRLYIKCTENTKNLLSSEDKENDAVDCSGELFIDSGKLSVISGGSYDKENGRLLGKGISADKITLTNCDLTVSSYDHGIKSRGELIMSGGEYSVTSEKGKGITAEGNVSLYNAALTVLYSEEALESKSTLTIDGGTVILNATDDGINTGGDTDNDHSLNIKNGTVIVTADGDGLDSNGDINISGGTVIVYGPVSDGESPLDMGERNKINITGGTVLALGSTGMMNAPEDNYIASRSLNAEKGDRITVTDRNNNVILSVVTEKSAKGITFGSVNAESCRIYKNATVSGTEDPYGVITSGTAEGGTEILSEEIEKGGFPMGGHFGGDKDMTPPDGFKGERPDGAFPEGMTPPEGMDFPNGRINPETAEN